MDNHYISERIRKRLTLRKVMNPRDKSFIRISYFNATVNILLKIIEESQISPAAIIAEDFAKKMDEYACNSKRNSNAFSIAKDAAEWVLDNIIFIQSNKGE